MTKNTMANKLPRKLIQKMEIVGEQIKLAGLRRNQSMAQVAERATCSEVTLCKVEKGLPTVSIGIYLRVLYALQLDDDILLLAKDDKLGRALKDMGLKNRQRASKKEQEWKESLSFSPKAAAMWAKFAMEKQGRMKGYGMDYSMKIVKEIYKSQVYCVKNKTFINFALENRR